MQWCELKITEFLLEIESSGAENHSGRTEGAKADHRVITSYQCDVPMEKEMKSLNYQRRYFSYTDININAIIWSLLKAYCSWFWSSMLKKK